MKLLLSIVLLLLLSSIGYAQRYRLVADSTFVQYVDEDKYELSRVTKYVYHSGDKWMSDDGRNFHFDTAFFYEINEGQELLSYKEVHTYYDNGKLQKRLWCDKLPISYRDDTNVAVAYDYYMNGAYVPVRIDSFAYNYDGTLAEEFTIVTTNNMHSHAPFECGVIYPISEYKFRLYEHITYQYSNYSLTSSVDNIYIPLDALDRSTKTTYEYYKDNKIRSILKVVTNSNSRPLEKTYIEYKKNGSNSLWYRKQFYDVNNEYQIKKYKQSTRVKVKDGIVYTECWQYESGEPKLLISSYEDHYSNDNRKEKHVNYFRVDAFSSQLSSDVTLYSYTPYGYIELTLQESDVYLHYNDNIKRTKTTYTYEQY